MMSAERVGRPEQHGIPMRGLARHQALGMAGAVEQEIRLEIFCKIVGNELDAIDHAFDHAVGEPRQRHGHGIEHLLLEGPFRGDSFGKRFCGDHHLAAGRRADRLAVERDGKAALGVRDPRLRIEALALGCAGGGPHRLLRILRGLPRDVVKQFPHPGFRSHPLSDRLLR
jgi:hypothetical protein